MVTKSTFSLSMAKKSELLLQVLLTFHGIIEGSVQTYSQHEIFIKKRVRIPQLPSTYIQVGLIASLFVHH